MTTYPATPSWQSEFDNAQANGRNCDVVELSAQPSVATAYDTLYSEIKDGTDVLIDNNDWCAANGSETVSVATDYNEKMEGDYYAIGIRHDGLGNVVTAEGSSQQQVGYDITNVSLEDTFIDTTNMPSPLGVWVTDDGTKMYTTDNTNNKLNYYTLDPAHDLSTATLQASVNSQGGEPHSIHLSSDGTKLFELQSQSGESMVYGWDLSTAWDISTYDYSSGTDFDFNFENWISHNNGFSMDFSTDGYHIYINFKYDDDVHQWTM